MGGRCGPRGARARAAARAMQGASIRFGAAGRPPAACPDEASALVGLPRCGRQGSSAARCGVGGARVCASRPRDRARALSTPMPAPAVTPPPPLRCRIAHYWSAALPPPLAAMLAADACALAACDNFWVPWVSMRENVVVGEGERERRGALAVSPRRRLFSSLHSRSSTDPSPPLRPLSRQRWRSRRAACCPPGSWAAPTPTPLPPPPRPPPSSSSRRRRSLVPSVRGRARPGPALGQRRSGY